MARTFRWALGGLILAAALLMGVGTSHADTRAFTLEVPVPELRTSGESDYYAIEGFGSSTNPYYPVLPTRKVHYEIPYAARDVSVMVFPTAAQLLGTHPDYLMRQPPLLLGDPNYVPPARPEKIPDVTPAEFYRYAGERCRYYPIYLH